MRSRPLPVPAGDPRGLNFFRCDRCGGALVTVDIDAGVTPAFLSCRITQACRGTGRSAWYAALEEWPASIRGMHVLHGEWYRPTVSNLRKLAIAARTKPEARAVYDHLVKGGLILRAATTTGLALAERLANDAPHSWHAVPMYAVPADRFFKGGLAGALGGGRAGA